MTTSPQQPASLSDTVTLPISGVAGDDPGTSGVVELVGLHGLAPKVRVNGEQPAKGLGQRFSIPMQDGTMGTLRMTATLPGYPKVDFNDERVYEVPRPPTPVLAVAFVPLVLVFFAFGVVGIAAAFGLHYLNLWLIKRPAFGNVAKALVPLAVNAALAWPIIMANQIVAQAIFA